MLLPVRFFSIYKAADLGCLLYFKQKKVPYINYVKDFSLKTAAIYSPTLSCSTIDVTGLNFSVRNGKRWNPGALTT